MKVDSLARASRVCAFCAACAVLALMYGTAANATVTVLHAFSGSSTDGNGGGNIVLGGDGYLYGTSEVLFSGGYIYKIRPSGSGFQILHTFTGSDGAVPFGGLIKAGDGYLYGTTEDGGTAASGTAYGVVYKMATDGTGFTDLHTFTGDDGANPADSPVVESGGVLYGVTVSGGPGYVQNQSNTADGVVYKLNTDGTGFATLHDFTGSDGSYLEQVILGQDGALYGTAGESGPGSTGNPSIGGVAFKIDTDGTNFSILHSFAGSGDGYFPSYLVQTSSGLLCGELAYGPPAGVNQGITSTGALYSMATDGSGYAITHVFDGPDGYAPNGLALGPNDVLYGTTEEGGPTSVGPDDEPGASGGTLFNVNPDGSAFALEVAFDANQEGGGTFGCLPGHVPAVGSGGRVYGETILGGPNGDGTIYSSLLTVPIPYIISTAPKAIQADTAVTVITTGGGFKKSSVVTLNGNTVSSSVSSGSSLKLMLKASDIPYGDTYLVVVKTPNQPQASNSWAIDIPSHLSIGNVTLTRNTNGTVSGAIQIQTSDSYPAANVYINRVQMTYKTKTYSPSDISLVSPGSPGILNATFTDSGNPGETVTLYVTITHSGTSTKLSKSVVLP